MQSSKILWILNALFISTTSLEAAVATSTTPATTTPSTTTTTTTPAPKSTIPTPPTTIPLQAAPVSNPLSDEDKIQEILDFWFGPLPSGEVYPMGKVSTWLGEDPETERLIRENFSDQMERATQGKLNNWRETPRGRLALILLIDQFPRIIYHGKPQSYISDPMARGLVLEGIQKGDDQHLFPIEQAFFYMPLQHAESAQMQALAVTAYQRLVNQSPDAIKPRMQEFLDFALLHQRQIAHFGRFPYRNAALGRPSTPEETLFLNQRDASGF